MYPNRIFIRSFALFVFALNLSAGDELTDDELTMLQDPAGWEYIKISDVHNGIQTQHTCFDGRPHPKQCSGILTLASDNTFVQNTRIHGETVQRHGTYQLDNDQLAFFDELGTRDGPYTLSINTQTKRLVMQMLSVRIELVFEKQYRKARQDQKRQPQQFQ